MRAPFLDFHELISPEQAQTQIVTANPRLRSELHYSYGQRQQALGISAWPNLAISSYSGWLVDCYEHLRAHLITDTQRAVVNNEALRLIALECAPSQDVEMHAPVIVQAWFDAWEWNLWTDWEVIRSTANGRLCDQWLTALRSRLAADELISVSEIPHALVRALESGHWRPDPLTLVGFRRTTRIQKQLFERLQQTTDVSSVRLQRTQSLRGELLHFQTKSRERAHIGQWIREQLEALGPRARIGVVVQDLASEGHRIHRQFESSFPELEDVDRIANVKNSIPLRRSSVYSDLMLFLDWTYKPLRYREVLRLGLSPLFVELNIPTTVQPWFQEELAMTRVGKQLSSKSWRQLLYRVGREKKRTASVGEHIATIQEFRNLLNWDSVAEADGTITSRELNAVYALFESVARTGSMLSVQSWVRTIDLIKSAAESTDSSQSNDRAAVQVMSPAESIGLDFDALWITNMADVEWPRPPPSNSMIPPRMLRTAQVHGAQHDDMLQDAHEHIQDWCAATENIVFSYVDTTDDSESLESPLLTQLATPTPRVPDEVVRTSKIAEFSHPWSTPPPMEPEFEVRQYFDDQAPTRSIVAGTRAKTGLLRDQVDCPFRAWAIHRMSLDTAEVEERFPGPAQRGTLVHLVLERIHKELKTPLSELNLNLRSDASKLIRTVIAEEHQSLPAKFVNHERKRILALLEKLQEFEKKRAPFEIINVETNLEALVGPFKFRVRVDRIDRTDDLSCFVVDYKTGKRISAQSWETSPLGDTQMPLYAIALEACDGFAQLYLHSDRVSWQGCVSFDYGSLKPPSKELSFAGRKEHWREALTSLTEDFANGVAKVEPQRSVCRHCHLQRLCRVDDDALVDLSDNDADVSGR